jgi:hypothetical protein
MNYSAPLEQSKNVRRLGADRFSGRIGQRAYASLQRDARRHPLMDEGIGTVAVGDPDRKKPAG